MSMPVCDALKMLLETLLEKNSETKSVEELHNKIKSFFLTASKKSDTSQLIKLYEDSLSVISPIVLSADIDEELIDLLHQVYQELESLIAMKGNDDRFSIVLVIPIADRPLHLQACLGSVLKLCEKFNYGGVKDNKYQKLRVLVADDSKDKTSINKHQQIVSEFNKSGIETDYFSLKDQMAQVDNISDNSRMKLSGVLGDNNKASFYHKGASIMRNIVYLKLNEMFGQDTDKLFYFIDSDQEFTVKINSAGQNKNMYLLNYFYELNKIFTQKNITMLTGKVVGDPPVSPAVMAGNFLDDVIAFLYRSSKISKNSSCEFHDNEKQKVSDASYHDMAELFGFNQKVESYQYNCELKGSHTNQSCFEAFSKELNRFFYGEHPTRKMFYEYEDAFTSVNSARTVYTGNYIFNTQGLKYFIPFATLKLRMAGPVLGRIIKSELGERFVSANLPMLHKRTFEDTGVSEFRPGIEQDKQLIDLSGEFERQYFGDVMLFTIERLTESGYPEKIIDKEKVAEILSDIEKSVNKKYSSKQLEIINKLNTLNDIFSCKDNWWHKNILLNQSAVNIQSFIDNINYNFKSDARGISLVNNLSHRKQRLETMLNAIIEFSQDRVTWTELLNSKNFKQ